MELKSNTPALELNRKHLLLGLVLRIRMLDGTYKIKFLWKRILLLILTLSLVAVCRPTTIYFFKYKRDFSEVAYTDMLLLPIRMAEHRKNMGQYHIDKGLNFYAQEKLVDAIRLLRLGLINAPDHIEARIVVAQFYLIYLRQPERAINIALMGLDYGGLENPDFSQVLILHNGR